jgi:hypothetical protein
MMKNRSNSGGGEHLREVRGERRQPAFFLRALLAEDIPPYLTDQRGVTLHLDEDPIAASYIERLDIDPASL